MARRQSLQDATGVLLDSPYWGDLFVIGTTVPTDGTQGYSPGCYFIDVDAAAGLQVFLNEGTRESCDFNALVPTGTNLATLTATAAEVNRYADVSTRIVDVTTSTLAVTEALHDGKTLVLDRAAGIALTLPTAAAGLKFRFIVKTTFVGAASIKSATGADIMIGHALMGNDSDNTTVLFQSLAAATNDTIDLFGTANSTGGIAGQVVTIEGLAANLWFVEICGDAAGTEATPFANTVT
jgi:hypothetical protein